MTPKERVETALRGGTPDRIPIVPIYDAGYVMSSIGRDQREWQTHDSAEGVAVIEESFLRHDVDGMFVHYGAADGWKAAHDVEVHDDYWLVTEKATGHQYRLLPNGCAAQADGAPIPRAPSSSGVSQITSLADIDRVFPKPSSAHEGETPERLAPLRHLSTKYPDHHFSFQTASPMPGALNACGGFVEGLTTMATERTLFESLCDRLAEIQCTRMRRGREAGGASTWFTSYYTGADTISPRDYAEIVFPREREICQAARDAGLFVLNWFLGDLMPILDKVIELPIDALVLEQGRKGYEIDPVEIRRRVGDHFCLFGFGYENDYCTFNRDGLSREVRRQIAGCARRGAFIVGTPIMPPDANPDAVDYYFAEARASSSD